MWIFIAVVVILLAIGGMQTRQDKNNKLTEELIQAQLGPQLAAERRAQQRRDKFWHGMGRAIGWLIPIGGLIALVSLAGCAPHYYPAEIVPSGGVQTTQVTDYMRHRAEADNARAAFDPKACNSMTPYNCLSPAQRVRVANPTHRELQIEQCTSSPGIIGTDDAWEYCAFLLNLIHDGGN